MLEKRNVNFEVEAWEDVNSQRREKDVLEKFK